MLLHPVKLHMQARFQFGGKQSINYNLGQNCRDKIEHLFFSEQIPLPQDQVVYKVFDYWQQNLPRFNNDIGDHGENYESEKLRHFLNLMDFQIWSQQVLSQLWQIFKNVNNYVKTSAMFCFYTSIGWYKHSKQLSKIPHFDVEYDH